MSEAESSGVVRYREPGATYLTTSLLAGLILIGFVIDLIVGGGVAHAIGWAIAFVLVVGAESLTVYAARVMRTVVITDDEIRVGEDTVSRAGMRGVELGGDADDRVLGRRYATGLPRGTQGVVLEQADGTRMVLATRHPDRVLATLGAEAPEALVPVRPAEPDDLPTLLELAERADSLFRVAGYELPDRAGRPAVAPVKAVLVVGRPPVGFVELAEVDGDACLVELDVLPSYMRRGYGTQLVEAASAWAREQGYRRIALTTYRDIAWNAPFFERLGYVQVDDAELDHVGPRVAMRLEL